MQIFYCLSNFGFDAQILRLVNISWTNVLQKKHALMDKCTAKIKHSIFEAEVTLLRSRSYFEAEVTSKLRFDASASTVKL